MKRSAIMSEISPDQDLVVFDGTCVYCSGLAQFIARRDRAGRFRFVTAHSPTGRGIYERYGLDPDAMETNIVVLEGQVFTRMRAFTAVMRGLGWPWKALCVLDWPPRALMDGIYDIIARNRYRLGKKDCPMPSAELRARLIE
ncbi:MAG: DUF393 domain-containing protein [Hirschia sp.]|nr:DUF393 domain-containing protein [Hirschia sp.]MBF19717.1 DUF393 domain-containing protein [Hirschia sp.]|tara:strand:+ start:131 stop:556 length:426 start_codon:yes stop_codon:yes gene_type:complete